MARENSGLGSGDLINRAKALAVLISEADTVPDHAQHAAAMIEELLASAQGVIEVERKPACGVADG